MENAKIGNEHGLGIGSTLSPGSFKVEGEVMLLRVRLKGTPVVCLIDGERRVVEMLTAPIAGDPPAVVPAGLDDVAFDASRAEQDKECSADASLARKHREAAADIIVHFEAALQRYAADGRACLRKMAAVLDPNNPHLACEHRDGGAPGLKAHLIRELFKRTVREERGFKILLLLSHVVALNGGGQPERLEPMSLEQQKKLLKEFMGFLKVAGHKRIDPRIFEAIYAKFNGHEYANLSRGGTGFFIKPLYVQEMQELRAQVLNAGNANYIDQLFSNSLRDPIDFLYENILAYLKALAIVRLYARSNRKERGGDSRNVEHILRDLIAFQPGWVKAAALVQGKTA